MSERRIKLPDGYAATPETRLDSVLLDYVVKLDVPRRLALLPIFMSQDFRTIITAHKIVLIEALTNIETEDHTKFHLQYQRIRCEMLLMEDLLAFLDQGLEHLSNLDPNLRHLTQSSNKGDE